MARGYVRIAWEDVPGNENNSPTASTKKLFAPLQEFSFEPGFAHLNRDDELVDTDEPRPDLPESADPTWSMRLRMYPDVIGFLLTTMLGDPTTTDGDGIITDPDSVVIPAGAYRHVWTSPFGPTGASPRTFEADVAYEDAENVFFKIKGGVITSLGVESPTEGGVSLSLSGPALYLARQSDPSLSPAYEGDTIPPFLRAHAGLSWAAGTADVRDLSLQQEMSAETQHTFGSGSKWADKVYKGSGPPMTTGQIQHNLIDADDYDKLEAATGFAATAKWVSTAIIASSYPYKVYSEISNAQLTGGGPDALTNQRRRGSSFPFKATRSGAAAVVFSVVNATEDYS